ncbi:uncharacterized protein G2W53_039633 [Senna tora]|uniref:Uncharacterized protein n=1 Tax=Senna tora TaxID=362788 RepID=A0A834W2Z1_9FABA|nr:uncharacterized protein G2W53_039633 [Senna tora]
MNSLQLCTGFLTSSHCSQFNALPSMHTATASSFSSPGTAFTIKYLSTRKSHPIGSSPLKIGSSKRRYFPYSLSPPISSSGIRLLLSRFSPPPSSCCSSRFLSLLPTEWEPSGSGSGPFFPSMRANVAVMTCINSLIPVMSTFIVAISTFIDAISFSTLSTRPSILVLTIPRPHRSDTKMIVATKPAQYRKYSSRIQGIKNKKSKITIGVREANYSPSSDFQNRALPLSLTSLYAPPSTPLSEWLIYLVQLLLEAMRFSSSTFLALIKFLASGDKELMDAVAKLILETLNLTKVSMSDAKKVQSFGSEILKVSHMVIDAVIKLCKTHSESVSWNTSDEKLLSLEKPNSMDHFINITKCTVDMLYQIGVLAANDGGNSVNILNVTWKGVVSLLQIGGGYLAEEVSITNILVSLLALVTEPLKCAAEAWSLPEETISVNEAKRILVPMKFYLITAVKIASLYPRQAFAVYREIMLCVLKITTFKIAVSNVNFLKHACAVTTELLEHTTIDLVKSLLNSDKLQLEEKFEVLEWLFISEGDSPSTLDCQSFSGCSLASMNEVFHIGCESMSRARILIMGRVVLFINFLRYCFGLDEDLKVGMTRKLQWLLDILVEEDVYSNMLVLQLPLLYGSGKTIELVWQPLFNSLLHAVKTFMIVVSSSTAWGDLESFLLENFLHPHFLCWEIVMECWCFILRHAETDMANSMISKLCSLLKLLASSESVLLPCSSVRMLARSICLLLTYGAQSMVNEVYMSLIGDARSQLSSNLCFALFIEGFPLDLLTDKLRKTAIQRVISDYFEFIESFDEALPMTSASDLFGIPVLILSAYLQPLQVCPSDIDARTLKLLVSVTHSYKSSVDKVIKDHYLIILGELLRIISSLKHLYTSNGIEEAILEMKSIFVSEPAASEGLFKCKPHLAHFMAGLVHMEISESDVDAKSRAVWKLYHILLKERHWAFIHLALMAFGYFAARTKCNQLWRFVPQDAALSYDLVLGTESNEDRFMVEFKTFLEKEMALLSIAPTPEQLDVLGREGFVLKELLHKIPDIAEEEVVCESMEIDTICSNKKRKLLDGINEGVELLKSGLKIIGDGLSQWHHNQFETDELHAEFLNQFSQLEDVITHFEGLASSTEACSSSLSTSP